MLHHSIVEHWVLNIDSRVTLKTNVRPVRYCMHSCEIVYKDILNRLSVENSIQEVCEAVHWCEAY